MLVVLEGGGGRTGLGGDGFRWPKEGMGFVLVEEGCGGGGHGAGIAYAG